MFDLPVIEYPQDFQLSQEGNAHESPLSLKMDLAVIQELLKRLQFKEPLRFQVTGS